MILTIEGPDEHAGLDVPRAAHDALAPGSVGVANVGTGWQEVIRAQRQCLRDVHGDNL